MSELFEQLDFVENPVYEKLIDDLSTQHYSIIDHFFTDTEVVLLREALLNKLEENTFKKAAIGNKVNETVEKSVRGDFIFWIDEALANTSEKVFFDKINDLISYLNKTCFMGILYKEFHYAIYPEGTFYKRHLDTFQNDDRRKLSIVCYLNEEDWQSDYGGELAIYTNENHREVEKTIVPFPGRLVIFESQLLEHEVKPVAHKRLSITGWLKTR